MYKGIIKSLSHPIDSALRLHFSRRNERVLAEVCPVVCFAGTPVYTLNVRLPAAFRINYIDIAAAPSPRLRRHTRGESPRCASAPPLTRSPSYVAEDGTDSPEPLPRTSLRTRLCHPPHTSLPSPTPVSVPEKRRGRLYFEKR